MADLRLAEFRTDIDIIFEKIPLEGVTTLSLWTIACNYNLTREYSWLKTLT